MGPFEQCLPAVSQFYDGIAAVTLQISLVAKTWIRVKGIFWALPKDFVGKLHTVWIDSSIYLCDPLKPVQRCAKDVEAAGEIHAVDAIPG